MTRPFSVTSPDDGFQVAPLGTSITQALSTSPLGVETLPAGVELDAAPTDADMPCANARPAGSIKAETERAMSRRFID
jgi:hypothetical protein